MEVTSWDDIFKYVSIVVTAVSFVTGFIQWLSQKKFEEKNKRYEQYNELMKIVSGNAKNQKEDRVTHTRLLTVICQLQDYKEYKDVTITVLEWVKDDIAEDQNKNPKETKMFTDKQAETLISTINKTISKVSGKKY